MKTHLNEPDDKAIEGANKAVAGCGLLIAGIVLTGIILYSLWALVW